MNKSKKVKKVRFVITFSDESFDISTPDGQIDYDMLLDTIKFIQDILIDHGPPENKHVSKKDLN